MFWKGGHADEFEVEFPAAEIEKAKESSRIVMKSTILADLTKTKDSLLDCSSLPSRHAGNDVSRGVRATYPRS